MSRRGLWYLLIAVTLGWGAPLQAQNRVGRPGLLDPTQANPLVQVQRGVLETILANGIVALEGAVDPAAYIVGPGDQFLISASIGTNLLNQVVPISADGQLTLPEVGSIQAAGHTLEDVQARALAALRESYQNVPIDVSLVQPRLFYVHISGTVPEPGRYLMLPIARVDDALQQAYASRFVERPDPASDGRPRILTSATSERPAMNGSYRASLRNVLLVRKDGTQESLDLIHYYNTGDLAHNPYLLDGDVIQVPSYHILHDIIRVNGDVTFPGSIDYRPGDTMRGILALATGDGSLDNLGTIRLTRHRPGSEVETRILDVQTILNGDGIPLEPGDFINIRSRERMTAAIQGMVEYPGSYPIVEGQTTLRQLVDMAGGLKADAAVEAAFLERRGSQALKSGSGAHEFDFFDLAYLQQSYGANRVVIDIAAALQPGAEDVPLYNNDRLVFPRDEGSVYVVGNVSQPGYIAYVPGQEARYYIEQSGGTGPLTTSVVVFEAGTGQIQTGDRAQVGPGDTVFVNRENVAESPEVASLLLGEEASKRQARILRTQNILTAITATVAVIGVLDRFGFFGSDGN